LIEIGSKTADKNCTNKQTNRQTDTTKIMVTWPWTSYYCSSGWCKMSHFVTLHVLNSCNLSVNLSIVWCVHIFVYPRHWIDPLISFFRLSVCLWTDWLSNDYVHSSLPIFTKFCMRLRNLVVSSPIVCETNRK